jgi:energy-coupling factor transport system ATP-binding protein
MMSKPDASLPALRVAHLVYHYESAENHLPEEPALDGVDLTVADNAYLAVVGQNGSGKTTLVKHFNGLLRPTAGWVWVYGVDTSTASVGELARTVGYVFQNPDHQIFCASTREEVAFGPRNLGLPPNDVDERVADALAAFNLTPYAEVPPAVLGYGLRRKVSIAAVYAMHPRVLILDEPTAGLDRRSADDLMRRMDALHSAGHTIVLVSHDMRLVAGHSRETLVMHEGRVLAYGETRAVLSRADDLARAHITPPQVMRLAQGLAEAGLDRVDALSVTEFADSYDRRRAAARRARGRP